MLLGSLLLPNLIARAQQEVYVDQFTGTAHVGIPLYTVGIKDAAISLGLDYAASGVKVDEVGGLAGVNWSLTGLPMITRQVRGLPDDVNPSNALRHGWLSGNSSRVNAFLNTSYSPLAPVLKSEAEVGTALIGVDGLQATGSTHIYDSEPDIFSYSLPGHSGKFVFDRTSNTIRTIPYDPIQISYMGDGMNNYTLGIGKFTIITPEGTTYTFGAADVMVKTRLPFTFPTPPIPLLFRREYDYLTGANNGVQNYATAWQVTVITNQFQEEVTFAYDNAVYNPDLKYLQTSYYLEPTGATPYIQFSWQYSSTKNWLQSITTPTHTVTFNLEPANAISDEKYLTRLDIQSNLVATDRHLKSYQFHYQHIEPPQRPDGPGSEWQNDKGEIIDHPTQFEPDVVQLAARHFLMGLDVTDHCANMPGYQFTYQGVSALSNRWAGSPTYPSSDADWVGLPPPGSGDRDIWGYCKIDPSLATVTPKVYVYPHLVAQQVPGAPYRLYPLVTPPAGSGYVDGSDRLPISDQQQFERKVLQGTLTQVALPTGGRFTMTYQPHIFYDSIAGANYTGGGARIWKVTLLDPLRGVEQEHRYTYTTNAEQPTANSSGRILRMPRYAFAAPLTTTPTNTLDDWRAAIIRSFDDLNTDEWESRTLGYGLVTEDVSGRGRTITTYALTGNADAKVLGNGQFWRRNLVSLIKQPTNTTLGVVPCTPGYDQYPFPPAANIDFRRGQPLKVERYAAAAAGGAPYTLVQRTQYIYKLNPQRPAVAVVGISYDKLRWSNNPSGTIFSVAPYRLLTDFSYVVTEQTEITYDQTTTSRSITRATRYGYNPEGQMVMMWKKEGSNNIYRTRYKFLSDYTYPAVLMNVGPLLSAQAQRRNAPHRPNELVETIAEVITPTGTRTILGGSMNTFALVPGGNTRPHQTWSWQQAPGLLNPDSVSIPTTGTIELHRPSRYQLAASVEEVSGNQTPLTTERRTGRQRSAQHLGYHQTLPILKIDNAGASEVVFSNFEAGDTRDAQYAFTHVGGTAGTIAAHTGIACLALSDPAQYLRTALPNKLTTSLAVAPEAFRFSFWAQPTALPATLTVSLQGTAWSASVPLTVAAKWQRYEVLVPVAALADPRSNYQLRLQPAAGTGQVHLDDVLLLPAAASAHSITYNPRVGKTSDLDGRGRVTYYDYDQAGMVRQIRDQQGIVRRIEIAPAGQLTAELPTPVLQHNYSMQGGVPEILSIAGLCTATVTSFAWNFGDGTSGSSTNPSISHTFPALPTSQSYTVVVILTTPQGPITVTQVVEVGQAPIVVDICKSGAVRLDRCGYGATDYENQCNDGSPLPPGSPNLEYTEYKVILPAAYQNASVAYTWHRVNLSNLNDAVVGFNSTYTTNSFLDQTGFEYYCVVVSGNLSAATPRASVEWYTTGNPQCN